jgi:hypothetical protein
MAKRLMAVRLNTLILSDIEVIAMLCGQTVSEIIREACKSYSDNWYAKHPSEQRVRERRHAALRKPLSK